MESADFLLRGRRAYEIGRLKWSLRRAAVTLPLVVLAAVVTEDARTSLLVGAALWLSCTFCFWRGQAAALAVRAGLLAGLVPFALLLTVRCGAFCELGGCSTHWVGFSTIGGLVAGVAIAARAWTLRDGAATFLLAASTIAALVGALGCSMAGLMGAVWMVLAELAATLPVFALRLRRH